MIAWSKLPHSFAMFTGFKNLLLTARIEKKRDCFKHGDPRAIAEKNKDGPGQDCQRPHSYQAIRADNNVLACVICEKTSKSQDPGRPGNCLAFPREKKTCQYCLWYYGFLHMHPHIEWLARSTALLSQELMVRWQTLCWSRMSRLTLTRCIPSLLLAR